MNGNDHGTADLADLLAGGIALARIGIGIAATLTPGWVARVQFGADSPAMRITVRMLGARDLALGAGELLSSRHGSASRRAWVEAGGVADAGDAAAFLRSGRGTARRRGLTIFVAAASAACSAWAARHLD